MGWYHDPSFNWGEGECAPACSIPNKAPNKEKTKSENAQAAKASGDTACPLPADSLPPPPPPNVDSIFHLCQKAIWDEAARSQQPYFPPTYMKDGKFTRATVYKTDLVATANEYYRDTIGEWIVIEIDCKLLFSLGIPIMAQDAPESKPNKQPVKCLSVFGGISTTLPGLVKQTYKMKRDNDGTFLKVLAPCKEEENKDDCSLVAASGGKARRFWPKKK
jgi:hypothetical protein